MYKRQIFYDAWHPYTWALLQALPQLGTKGEALPTIDGTPPNLFNEIKGDAFALIWSVMEIPLSE